jgi:hypothetical protein
MRCYDWATEVRDGGGTGATLRDERNAVFGTFINAAAVAPYFMARSKSSSARAHTANGTSINASNALMVVWHVIADHLSLLPFVLLVIGQLLHILT